MGSPWERLDAEGSIKTGRDGPFVRTHDTGQPDKLSTITQTNTHPKLILKPRSSTTRTPESRTDAARPARSRAAPSLAGVSHNTHSMAKLALSHPRPYTPTQDAS